MKHQLMVNGYGELTTTSSNSGNVVGPGWFYEYGNPAFWNNGNAGDDWGDFGTTCIWSFCFDVTVVPVCNSLDLTIK
jgi:hypothetical protein